MNEPILHLAKRAIKRPEDLRASEIKRMAQWVELAYRERERETGAINGTRGFTRESSDRLEIGKHL